MFFIFDRFLSVQTTGHGKYFRRGKKIPRNVPGNSVLNRVLRDIAAARLDKRETQTGIRVRIAPAHSSGYDDFTDELRPEIGALGVLATLAVLNIGPLGMTRHLLINLKGVVVRGHPTPASSTDSSA